MSYTGQTIALGTDPNWTPLGAFNNNVGTVGGGVASQQVVSTIFSYDPFAFWRLVQKRHGMYLDFASMLKMLGPQYSRGVAAPTIGHYEHNNWSGQVFKFAAINTASTGAGTNVIIDLHADSMYNAGQTVSGVAQQSSEIRVNDVLLGVNGIMAMVTAKNTAVSPHRITLRPLKATDDLVAAFPANCIVACVTNAFAEGSGLPSGFIPRIMTYSNTFQIVKEAFSVTGSELTNQPFQLFQNSETGSIYMEIQDEMANRFQSKRAGALLWGEQIDNITDTATAVGHDISVRGTEGFMRWTADNSYTDNYTAGSYTLADFRNVFYLYEQEQGGSRNLMALAGMRWLGEVETTLQGFFDASFVPGLINESALQYQFSDPNWSPSQDASFIARLGFKGVSMQGYSVAFLPFAELNRADGAGNSSSTYTYNRWAFFLPMTNVTDATSGQQRPTIGYEYKQLGNISRDALPAILTGAGAPLTASAIVSTANDIAQMGMISEVAFHGACPNKVVRQKV